MLDGGRFALGFLSAILITVFLLLTLSFYGETSLNTDFATTVLGGLIAGLLGLGASFITIYHTQQKESVKEKSSEADRLLIIISNVFKHYDEIVKLDLHFNSYADEVQLRIGGVNARSHLAGTYLLVPLEGVREKYLQDQENLILLLRLKQARLFTELQDFSNFANGLYYMLERHREQFGKMFMGDDVKDVEVTGTWVKRTRRVMPTDLLLVEDMEQHIRRGSREGRELGKSIIDAILVLLKDRHGISISFEEVKGMTGHARSGLYEQNDLRTDSEIDYKDVISASPQYINIEARHTLSTLRILLDYWRRLGSQ